MRELHHILERSLANSLRTLSASTRLRVDIVRRVMSNPTNHNIESHKSENHQLVFFGEDWGRHPSTAQYLAGQLLDSYCVTWINSIGLREPSLSAADLDRVVGKVKRAAFKGAATDGDAEQQAQRAAVEQPQHLVSPWVLPWHRLGAVQALNKAVFKRQIAKQPHLQTSPYRVVTANPASYYLLDTLQPESSLYYCADKYAQIAGLNPTLVDRFERELLERVDTVAATSLPLVDDLSKHHNNVHYLPHGVDYARFNSTLLPPNQEQEQTQSEAKQVIGFVGLLGEHIDFDLIKASAAQLSDAHFLFVGPVEQGITLPTGDNLEYLGSVDQSELPEQLRRMDICTLPYAMTERNHYANPTKVREYLAAGRAVVATKQPGLMDIEGEVSITSDTAGYVSALQERLSQLPARGSIELHKAREAIAVPMKNETWSARAAKLQTLINNAPT